MNIDFIDTDEEHNRVLFELNLLDDDDDWKLFQEQERILDNDISTEFYEKYLKYHCTS